jgi:methionyl-tRNA formyltransferase
MGTPEFAVPSLEMLVNEGYEVVAVVTQPDKPKGRGNKLTASPVKEYALSKGIPVLQPEKIRTVEFYEQIKSLTPDLMVTAAYGKIIPKDVLELPKLGCINIHGSLLPKLRGAAPIYFAIINGESISGITTMFTDVGLDTGDILLKKEVIIDNDMTTGELHDKLSILGTETLKETLQKLEQGTLIRIPQNNDDATYAPIIRKEIGKIDWNNSSMDIHNLIRGTNPWPGAYTYYRNERMRVWKSKLTDCDNSCIASEPGKICSVKKEGIIVSTGLGMLRIVELQFDSSRKMSVEEYIVGHRIDEGEILG